MKRTWGVALLSAVTLLFAACGDGEEPTGGGGEEVTHNLWYVNPLPNTPDWGRSATVFEEAAAELGYEATVVGPNAIDIPAMVSQIEQAIADGADGILTCPLDPAAFKGVIDQAQNQGIVVASIGCVDDNADFSVGTDNAEYGVVAADFIADQTGGKAKVGIIGTDQTTPNQVAQVESFEAHIAENYADMEVVVWESDNSDAGVAAQKIPAMIAAYPEMNYLWIIEGAAPGAVPGAFQEAGVQPGEIGVLAIDAQESTLKAVEEDWITATLNQCWFDAAPQASKRMIELIGGKEQPQFVPIAVDPVTADRLPYQGCPAEFVEY